VTVACASRAAGASKGAGSGFGREIDLTNMVAVKTVGICDTQPLTIGGLESLLHESGDMQVVGSATSLFNGLEMVQNQAPAIVLIDKAFGLPAVMDWLADLRSTETRSVVWGVSLNEAEALRLMQAGAQGVIRKTATSSTVLSCLRTVATGTTWMEDSLLGDGQKVFRSSRSNLTPREHQVVELVEQGMKNKDIAVSMGIRPGTVKIHLKHIFEKTGIRGRYGLALSGLREKGLLSYPIS
jgi:two-component system, NarL family, nitrate/nitrite response regulator NarL